jgi:outer membrane receptor for ferrienterochelin and colicin
MQKLWQLFIIVLLSNMAGALCAQVVGDINGTVVDARTKDPLVGVNVLLLGTDRGAATDVDGNFKIEQVPVGTYRLRFDFIGFESLIRTDVVVISARHTVANVELQESSLQGQEVTVTAGYFVEEANIQPSTIGLSREEIRRFPGGFEDVVRTVSTLPGVAINAAGGRNDLLVRGGGPSENLYIVNNIEVPNINHFGNQGNSSGSLSFVNLDFVDDVSFSTGGFSARYGDKMSSVLGLTMRQTIPEHFESKWTVSASQYGFNLDAPLNGKGNVIFSVRKSYLDLIFKAAGLAFVPVYTDFNIVASYDLSPKDKLFFLGLSALDNINRDMSTLENRVSNAALMDNTQYQGIAGLNYRRLLSHGYLDLTLSNNLFRYRFSQMDEHERTYFDSNADERETYLKAQHYWVAAKTVGVRSGMSVKIISNDNTTAFADTIYDRNGNRIPISQLGVANVTKTNSVAEKYAAFVETDWTIHPRLELNAGLRCDYYGFINHALYLAPRLALKYKLTEKHSLRLSGGVYYQSPSYVWVINEFNKGLKALQNRMAVLGWDYLIRSDVRMAVETYYKDYHDLPTGTIPGRTDYIVINNTGTGYGGRENDFQSFGYFNLISKGTGKAYGLDFVVQKKFSEIPLYGQASLSYGKSEFTAANGTATPGQYDQRWIFNLSGGYIFNAKWEFAAKFRYYTGAPYTPIYRPSTNPVHPGSIQNLPQEYLTARLKPGHHLDIRIDRFWNFRNWTLITYLDIQNVYNYKIPQRPSYDFWKDEIITSSAIGLLPSVGISAEF